MSINASKTTLSLIYNGEKIDLFTDDLEVIDRTTKKEISKYSFLKQLLNSPTITQYAKEIITKIMDEMPRDFLYDEEYKNFEFILTLKNTETKKQLVLPVIYHQYTFDTPDISAQIRDNSEMINRIFKLYEKRYEKDAKNKEIINKVVSSNTTYLNSNLKDELMLLPGLEEKKRNNIWLSDEDYTYYLKLRNCNYELENRDKNISKFLSSIKKSHYKLRTFCLVKQLCEGELNEMNTELVINGQKTFDEIGHLILESTEQSKRKI